MAHFKFIITLLTIVFVFISCSTENPVLYNRSERDEIFPLAAGNYWKYEGKEKYNFFDSTNYKSSVKTYTQWFNITGDTLVEDSLLFIQKAKTLFHQDNPNNYFATKTTLAKNTLLGYSILFSDSVKNIKLYARYPCKIGEKLSNDSDLKLILTNEVVKTPIGSFICYHFQCKEFDTNGNLSKQCDEFYSVGFGHIKSYVYRKDDIGIIEYEKILTELSVK